MPAWATVEITRESSAAERPARIRVEASALPIGEDVTARLTFVIQEEAVEPARVVSVATLIKYNDAARSESTEAIAYTLLPEHKAYIWQVGGGDGGASGSTLRDAACGGSSG